MIAMYQLDVSPLFSSVPWKGGAGGKPGLAQLRWFSPCYSLRLPKAPIKKKSPMQSSINDRMELFYLLVCILLITFSLVNSSLSFSSSAFWMFFVRASYIGIVIFFSAFARFWVFLMLAARR